jgi:hypothetical protein
VSSLEFSENINKETDPESQKDIPVDNHSKDSVEENKLKNKKKLKEIEQRDKFTNWTIRLVSRYLICVFIIIISQIINCSFLNKLDNMVMITLLSTTTINILGLPFLIIKRLFKSEKRKIR